MQPTEGHGGFLACIRGGTDMITILIADDENWRETGSSFC